MTTKFEMNAEHMSCLLEDMYQSHTVGDEKPIPMYSFSRPARVFYEGVIQGLMDNGLTTQQITEVLHSKYMRWMLDDRDEELITLGKSMVNESMVKWGKEQ